MDKRTAYLQRINDVFPEVAVGASDVSLTRGQFNDVIIIDNKLVFRFPRSPQARHSLATETLLLHALQGHLPLPVPDPVYAAPDGLFTGYRMLRGVPFLKSTMADIGDGEICQHLASQLGAFPKVLHAVDASQMPTGFPETDTGDSWTALYRAFRDELFAHVRPDARNDVSDAFASFLGEPKNVSYRRVLRHGDFGGANILYDPKQRSISGVIDFGSAALGDPAVDLAALMGYGPYFVSLVLEHYPKLGSTSARKRAAFYRSTHALQQALWASRAGDHEEFEDGIAAYR